MFYSPHSSVNKLFVFVLIVAIGGNYSQMIEDLKVTPDRTQVGSYAGLIESQSDSYIVGFINAGDDLVIKTYGVFLNEEADASGLLCSHPSLLYTRFKFRFICHCSVMHR